MARLVRLPFTCAVLCLIHLRAGLLQDEGGEDEDEGDDDQFEEVGGSLGGVTLRVVCGPSNSTGLGCTRAGRGGGGQPQVPRHCSTAKGTAAHGCPRCAAAHGCPCCVASSWLLQLLLPCQGFRRLPCHAQDNLSSDEEDYAVRGSRVGARATCVQAAWWPPASRHRQLTWRCHVCRRRRSLKTRM